MNIQFYQDFNGPTAFYKLLSDRQKCNPLFLNRNLRKKYVEARQDQIKVELSGLQPPFDGKLFVCLIATSTIGVLPIEMIDSKIISVSKGEKVCSHVVLKSMLTAPKAAVLKKEYNLILSLLFTSNDDMASANANSTTESSMFENLSAILDELNKQAASGRANECKFRLNLSYLCLLDVKRGVKSIKLDGEEDDEVSPSGPLWPSKGGSLSKTTDQSLSAEQAHLTALHSIKSPPTGSHPSVAQAMTVFRSFQWPSSSAKNSVALTDVLVLQRNVEKICRAERVVAASDLRVDVGLQWLTAQEAVEFEATAAELYVAPALSLMEVDGDGVVDLTDSVDNDVCVELGDSTAEGTQQRSKRKRLPVMASASVYAKDYSLVSSSNTKDHTDDEDGLGRKYEVASDEDVCELFYHYCYSANTEKRELVPLVNKGGEPKKGAGRPVAKSSSVAQQTSKKVFKTVKVVEARTVVERKNSVCCPWCDVDTGMRTRPIVCASNFKHYHVDTYRAIQLLLTHLKTCHQHFVFESTVDQFLNLHIHVKRDRTCDKESLSLQERFVAFEHYSPLAYTLVPPKEVKKVTAQSLAAPIVKPPPAPLKLKQFGNFIAKYHAPEKADAPVVSGKEAKKRRTTREALMMRQYYHSATSLPIPPEEIFYNSDDEVDNTYGLQKALSVIDEYSDITAEEKEFMKLWNIHINSFPCYGDRLLPIVCDRFVSRFAHSVYSKGLRHNMLLHFMTMWDFGLLLYSEVVALLAKGDRYYYNVFVRAPLDKEVQAAQQQAVDEAPKISGAIYSSSSSSINNSRNGSSIKNTKKSTSAGGVAENSDKNDAEAGQELDSDGNPMTKCSIN